MPSPKSPKAAKAPKPRKKVKGRPGLATVVGRAVVLPEFLAALRADPAAAAQSIDVTLNAGDLDAIRQIDWSAAEAAAATLRATLPEVEAPTGPIMEDAAGW